MTENIRDPWSTVSDLRAQRAACVVGDDACTSWSTGTGATTVLAINVMDRMLDTFELVTRQALAALPDGEAEAEGFLDDDGRGGRPTRVHVRRPKVRRPPRDRPVGL